MNFRFPKIFIAILAIFAVSSVVPTFAEVAGLKIGYVDMNYLINESNRGQKVKKEIEGKVKIAQQSMESKKTKLDGLVNEIRSSTLLSDDARKNKQAEAQNLMGELQQMQAQNENTFRELDRQKTEEIVKEIRVLIEAMAKKQKYDFIFEKQFLGQGIVYTSQSLDDLTKDVLKEFNKASK